MLRQVGKLINHDNFAIPHKQKADPKLRSLKNKIYPGNFLLCMILGFSAFQCSELSAQFEHKLFTSNMLVEAKVNYGFIYAHQLQLEIFNSHLTAFELNLQQETFGKKKWERAFNYPLIGLSFWYSDLGKSPYLGSAFAIFPFINFPLVKHKKVYFGFRFGLGVGYLTKKFDRLTNYKNLAIGGHFNAAANIMFELRYRLSNRFTLSSGICLQHFSNGSLKLPNYGLNLPLVNLGLAYRLVRENKSIGDRFYPPLEPFSAIIRRAIEFNIGVAIGYKNLQSVYGENYFVFHFHENTLFRVSRKSKIGFGFDVSYDPSMIKKLEMNNIVVENKFNIVRPGINAAYELVMSKIGFIFNLGYYLAGQETSNGPLYEKLSFQYNFSKNFFGNVMLKVHWGRADYIGWGVGYKFDILYGKKIVK
jgi:hypothetical protein